MWRSNALGILLHSSVSFDDAKAKGTIINSFLRQLRHLESSARETLLPCHYDIELDMVDIALWIEA